MLSNSQTKSDPPQLLPATGTAPSPAACGALSFTAFSCVHRSSRSAELGFFSWEDSEHFKVKDHLMLFALL